MRSMRATLLWLLLGTLAVVMAAAGLLSYRAGLQEAGEIRATNGNANAIAALGERAHHMPTDEARAPENGDERRKVGQGHGRLP